MAARRGAEVRRDRLHGLEPGRPLHLCRHGRSGETAAARGLGPLGRLSSHASGRRSGDQFCVYVCDRLVLTTVRDRIDDMAAGGFLLDGATRHYVRAKLGFRIVEVTDGREALQVERRVQRGELAAGRPASQSARLGLLALLWEGGGDKLGLFMQAGEAGPDILRLGLDGDEASSSTVMASLGSIASSSTWKL